VYDKFATYIRLGIEYLLIVIQHFMFLTVEDKLNEAMLEEDPKDDAQTAADI
jgi:hypothetical protein